LQSFECCKAVNCCYFNSAVIGPNPWEQKEKLLASDPATFRIFGGAVSLSNNIALIGARGGGTGSAYVYRSIDDGNTWPQAAKLVAADGESGDLFGKSVSVDGFIALIGAVGDDDQGTDAGSAYIFQSTDTGATWSQGAKLVASDGVPSAGFGISVSLEGFTALIGAAKDDDKGTFSGSAYIFRSIDGGSTWNQTAKLLASDGGAQEYFGSAVSLHNNIALVGAYKDDSGRGGAYVFRSIDGGSTWNQAAKLVASDGAANDNFGYSVSVHNNIALIGEQDASLRGGAYIFQSNDGGITWDQGTKLKPSDAGAIDRFGTAVSVCNGTAMIGSPYQSSSRGSAYVFEPCTRNCGKKGVIEIARASDGENEGLWIVSWAS
jgi:hypothetical protein